jgi:hypothetical protein
MTKAEHLKLVELDKLVNAITNEDFQAFHFENPTMMSVEKNYFFVAVIRLIGVLIRFNN